MSMAKTEERFFKGKEVAHGKYLPLYDIHQAAFLEYRGTELTLTKQGTRVVFEAPATEKTYKLLREYQDNNLIPLLDYVAVLRRLRARMLEARDGNGRRERETTNGYHK
jgi:hypothetical protein